MKDYLKLRIPYRVRIHGGGCDASARATHHAGKEDRLITNKSAFSTKAELGIVPISTIERKQMSTKTNFKRIAVVAVASLGLGVFTSIAPANAAVTRVSVGTLAGWTTSAAGAYAGVGTSTPTQIVGGTAVLTFAETITTAAVGDIISNISSTGVGSITAASGTNVDINPLGTGAASQTVTYPTSSVSVVLKASGGASAITSNTLATATIRVSSMVAGTQTLTASVVDANGTPTASYTATVTWVATGAGVGVNVANSSFYVIAVGDTCDYGTSKSTDMAQASALAAVTRVATGTQPLVCVSTRDASGNSVEQSSVTVFSSLGGASVSPSDSGTAGKAAAQALSANATSGNAIITAIITDIYGNVVTMTTPLAYYGSLKTLTLANASYAAKYDGVSTLTSGTVLTSIAAAAAGDIGTPTSKDGALVLIGKDANGAQISLNDVANGTGSTFTIDSSAVAGTPADRSSDALGSAVATSYTASDIKELGGNALKVTCGAVKAEKLTITAWGTDSAGARVKSNSVDFYCASAVDKVTVTASGTSVNVDVTDANGFPVADGTSVALAASNGSVVAPSAKTTANGKFATAATFIANSTAATSSVTAIVGDKSGTSAAVKGSGTSIEAQIASMLKLINKIMKRLNIR